MPTPNFDQKTDQPFGSCTNCNTELATEELAREHMAATMTPVDQNDLDPKERDEFLAKSSSHRILISNPSRASRIGNEVDSLVDDALSSVTEDLDDLVQSGAITRAEATAAIARWSDFSDDWSSAGHDKDEDDTSAD
jgi:hypothetical protein